MVKNRSKAILLVDDESDITTLFQYYLESSGYRVKIYNDLQKALLEFRAGYARSSSVRCENA